MSRLLRRLGVGGLGVTAVWLVSFVVLLVSTPRSETPTGIAGVSGDGIYYFVQLESLVRDRDVDYRNNLEPFAHNPHVAKQLESGVVTPTRRTPNLFSIGPALLWSPLYLLALPFSRPVELLAPAVATSLYVLVGLLALFATLRRLGFSQWVSAGAVVVTYSGTNLLYYSTFEASMAHGLGFAVLSALLWLVIRVLLRSAEQKTQSPRAALGAPLAAALGVLAGLAGLVRWQLLLAAIPLVLVALWRQRVQLWVWAALGLVVGIAPQLAIWKSLYGSFFVIPQGSGFILPTSPHFGEVLVSSRHGLLTWSPLIALAVLGLIAHRAHLRILAVTALVIVVVQTYINGSLLEWWGGDAFGARRFTDIAALFAVGFAIVFASVCTQRIARWVRWCLVGIVALSCLANLALMQLYRTDRISRSQPVHVQDVVDALLD